MTEKAAARAIGATIYTTDGTQPGPNQHQAAVEGHEVPLEEIYMTTDGTQPVWFATEPQLPIGEEGTGQPKTAKKPARPSAVAPMGLAGA